MSNSPIRKVQADNLPKPVGPYSPATAFERLVFVSGQSGRNPATGVTEEGVEAQTEQTLKNIETILKAAGTDLQHVLRCGVFLMDMTEFPKMNAVYERMFAGHKPARTTVQVTGLPGESLRVEIDCIAVLPTDKA